jgi:cytochrome b involved in lipid metabolism
VASNAANKCRLCRVHTTEELAAHNSLANGLWLCIAGRVYDVTAWAPSHPGGLLPLFGTAGADCTDVFRVFHSEDLAQKRLPAFQIGIMGRFDSNTGKLVGDEAEWGETPMQKVSTTHTYIYICAHTPRCTLAMNNGATTFGYISRGFILC